MHLPLFCKWVLSITLSRASLNLLICHAHFSHSVYIWNMSFLFWYLCVYPGMPCLHHGIGVKDLLLAALWSGVPTLARARVIIVKKKLTSAITPVSFFCCIFSLFVQCVFLYNVSAYLLAHIMAIMYYITDSMKSRKSAIILSRSTDSSSKASP